MSPVQIRFSLLIVNDKISFERYHTHQNPGATGNWVHGRKNSIAAKTEDCFKKRTCMRGSGWRHSDTVSWLCMLIVFDCGALSKSSQTENHQNGWLNTLYLCKTSQWFKRQPQCRGRTVYALFERQRNGAESDSHTGKNAIRAGAYFERNGYQKSKHRRVAQGLVFMVRATILWWVKARQIRKSRIFCLQ